jgi:uncharacterized protein YecE (DUF72 family)
LIRIGTAGWSIPRAMAAGFPGEGTHLARYARVMHCCEIDTSFYRSHALDTYRKWAALTPRGFRFAVKLPRSITHDARLRNARIPLERFLAEVAGLGSKLGVLLVQLPPSLEFEARIVRSFFSLLRKRFEGAVVVEARHASWFEPAAGDSLARLRVGRVAADPALVAVATHPGGWLGPAGHGVGATLYYRWHGSPRVYWSSYSEAQLARLDAELKSLPRGADVWCIFDNTASGAAIENAVQLVRGSGQ